MKFRPLVFAAALLFSAFFSAAAETVREATLVPQIVYVGDRARLIVPLEAAGSAPGPVVFDQAESLPKTGSVVIHRFEIARRPGSVRAIIDFTAFAPGDVALPALELGGVRLNDLRVKISSVLEEGMTELAPPEEALAAPGTYFLIYGAIFLVLLTAVGVLLFVLKGLPWISAYLERRRRGLAARSLRRVLARLRSDGASMDAALFLTVLFEELRSYLTYRSGRNCHALTAREFPLVLKDESIQIGFSETDLTFLESLFRTGDAVRFGAAPVSRGELSDALRGVGDLVDRAEAP